MLGGSEDLAAVLTVLDHLSNELKSNRHALDSTCEKADEVSGGNALTTDYAGEWSIDELKQHIEQEKKDCEFLRQSLESAIELTSVASRMMHALSQAQAEGELEVHKAASKELLSWQIEVQDAAEKYHSLEAQNIAVNEKLAKLYKLLQLRASA